MDCICRQISSKALLVITLVIILQFAVFFWQNIDCMRIVENFNQQAAQHETILPSKYTYSNKHQIKYPKDRQRPIWNIAHMVNSIKELDYRLLKGANAVEADVTFDASGYPLFTFHGPPCDCWRHCYQEENFSDYLRYIRDSILLQSSTPNLTLLVLDLKLDNLSPQSKIFAGKELSRMLVEDLFTYKTVGNQSLQEGESEENSYLKLADHNIKVIISVNHINDDNLILNFLHNIENSSNLSSSLLPRIGFDVGMNDDLKQIENMWRRLSPQTVNVWQGDGWTNCISPFYNLGRLTRALSIRDSLNRKGYMKKVYQWTIDLSDGLRDALKLGVDAVMTNHPERLLALLMEPEMIQQARLATAEDNPFERFEQPEDYYITKSIESARNNNPIKPTTFYGTLFHGLIDIFSSWVNYVQEIPLFSLPTTKRFLFNKPGYRLGLFRTQEANNKDKISESRSSSTSETSTSVTTINSTMKKSTKKSTTTTTTITTEVPTTTITTTKTTTTPTTTTSESDTKSSKKCSDSEDDEDKNKSSKEDNSNDESKIDELKPDPPKWYISVATNVLVGVLRGMLPPSSD